MTAETASPAPGRLRHILHVLVSNRVAGWLDQAVVSGTNFLALLLLGRWAGAEDLGFYAIGFSILALAMTVQDSLVTRPYAVQIFKPPVSPGSHAFGTLAFALLLSAAIGGSLAVCAFLLVAAGSPGRLTQLLGVLALAAPLVLWREFARRFAFAHLEMRRALALDLISSLLLMMALAALAWQNWLGASTTFAAMAVSSGCAALVWLAFRCATFTVSTTAARQTARQSWGLGKWLLLSQLALQAQGYAAQWIIFIAAGAAWTGVYSACLSIVGLANPFLFGLFNILTPRFVRALRDAGETGLARAAFRETMIISAIMGSFTLVLLAAGDMVIAQLFPDAAFLGHAGLLPLLALASAIAAAGAPATIALSVAERGRAIAGLAFAICILGSVLVWLFLAEWGLTGAACGILVTEIAGTSARWILFLKRPRAVSEALAPAQVSAE